MDHVELAIRVSVVGDGPVDGNSICFAICFAILIQCHISVAVGVIHQVQIHEVVLRIHDCAVDCLFSSVRQCLGRIGQLVSQQVDLSILPDRDGAVVDVVSHVIGCDSRDLIKLLRFFSYNCAGRIFALHAPDRQVTRIHKDGIGVAFNNGLNLICLDVSAAVDGHGVFLIQGFHIKAKPIAGLFLASCIFDQKPNGGLISTGFQLIDEFLIGNVVDTRRGVVHFQRPMFGFGSLVFFVNEGKLLRQIHRAGDATPQLVVQSGGQGDVEAGLREAVAVTSLKFIAVLVHDAAFIIAAAGVDGDVGGGDDDLVDVGRAVVVLVIAPQGVDRVILVQVHSVHRGGDRPIFRILDAVDFSRCVNIRRPTCEEDRLAVGSVVLGISIGGIFFLAKCVALGICQGNTVHDEGVLAVDLTAVGVIGQFILGGDVQVSVQMPAGEICGFRIPVRPRGHAQIVPFKSFKQTVIRLFLVIANKFACGKRGIDDAFILGIAVHLPRLIRSIRQEHIFQLAQDAVALRVQSEAVGFFQNFLLGLRQRTIRAAADRLGIDVDVLHREVLVLIIGDVVVVRVLRPHGVDGDVLIREGDRRNHAVRFLRRRGGLGVVVGLFSPANEYHAVITGVDVRADRFGQICRLVRCVCPISCIRGGAAAALIVVIRQGVAISHLIIAGHGEDDGDVSVNRPVTIDPFQGDGLAFLTRRGQGVVRRNICIVRRHIGIRCNTGDIHIVGGRIACAPPFDFADGIAVFQAIGFIGVVSGFAGAVHSDCAITQKPGIVRVIRVIRAAGQVLIGGRGGRGVDSEIPIHVVLIDRCTEISARSSFVNCDALNIGASIERCKNLNGLDFCVRDMGIVQLAIRINLICIAIENQIVSIFPSIMINLAHKIIGISRTISSMYCNFDTFTVNIVDGNIGIILGVVEFDISGKNRIIFIHNADSGACMYINTRQLLCECFGICIDNGSLRKLRPAFFFCTPVAERIRNILRILGPVCHSRIVVNNGNVIQPKYTVITC